MTKTRRFTGLDYLPGDIPTYLCVAVVLVVLISSMTTCHKQALEFRLEQARIEKGLEHDNNRASKAEDHQDR